MRAGGSQPGIVRAAPFFCPKRTLSTALPIASFGRRRRPARPADKGGARPLRGPYPPLPAAGGPRMSWRPILLRSGPTLLLALLAVAMPSLPAAPQELSTEERLDRLERDLSMLQRQVYGQSGGGAEMGPEGAADIEVRMERLEQQMRDLTGRVEEMANRVDRLRQRLEQISSDIDVRLGQGAA